MWYRCIRNVLGEIDGIKYTYLDLSKYQSCSCVQAIHVVYRFSGLLTCIVRRKKKWYPRENSLPLSSIETFYFPSRSGLRLLINDFGKSVVCVTAACCRFLLSVFASFRRCYYFSTFFCFYCVRFYCRFKAYVIQLNSLCCSPPSFSPAHFNRKRSATGGCFLFLFFSCDPFGCVLSIIYRW